MNGTQKEYFFSFDRIHKELKHLMSQNYDDYKIFSELDLLCGHYLGRGRIGYYDEVEWCRFGITTEALSKMMILIGYPTECLKVLVYFRDHPYDILGENVDDAVLKEFEMTCCQGINNYMKPIMEEKRKGGTHVITAMEVIEHGDFYKWAEKYDISKWGKGYQIIAAKIPHPIDDDPRSDIIRPFYILNIAAGMHQRIILQMQNTSPDILAGDIESWFDIDGYVHELNKHLSSGVNYSILNLDIPATQILFALSLFLISNFQSHSKEPYLEVCEKLQKYLLKYITDNYNILSIILSSRTHDAKKELADIGNEEFYRLMEIPYVGTFRARDRSADEVAKINKERNNSNADSPTSETDYCIITNRALRCKKFKVLSDELTTKLGFKGGSQWFYVYKLMVEKGIYINRQYQQFKKDLETADIPKLPKTSTFTRKYKQLPEGSTYPWRTKNNGRSDILDEGNKIAEIAKDILGL